MTGKGEEASGEGAAQNSLIIMKRRFFELDTIGNSKSYLTYIFPICKIADFVNLQLIKNQKLVSGILRLSCESKSKNFNAYYYF